MNDLMATDLAQREQTISSSHSSPGIVKTGLQRELPFWARAALKIITPLLTLFTVGANETGARQLFMATSGVYPPLKPVEGPAGASGVPPEKGVEVMKGGSGHTGDGGYNLT